MGKWGIERQSESIGKDVGMYRYVYIQYFEYVQINKTLNTILSWSRSIQWEYTISKTDSLGQDTKYLG
jgi:hypothetical protein